MPQRTFKQSWIAPLGVPLGVLLVACVLFAGCTQNARVDYQPKQGDILFQSLPHHELTDAIEGITQSPYSHCGVITQREGEFYVIEAIGPVKETPVAEFIQRGRGRQVAVYRLDEKYTPGIDGFVEHLRDYLGRPYDFRYRMDDERIYCSELIYKAFDQQYGEPLGAMDRLGDMNWKPYQATIMKYEGGPAPLDLMMITPQGVADAEQLTLIHPKAPPGQTASK